MCYIYRWLWGPGHRRAHCGGGPVSSAQVLTEWLWSQNPERGCGQSDWGAMVHSAGTRVAAVPLISAVLTRGHRARVQN